MKWTTYTERFDPIRHRAERSGKCPVCGKRVVRRTTFQQTINPFNKLPDGTPKTRVVIEAELRAEAAGWHPDFMHEKCADGGDQS